ncbi:unnamed protein product [Spodoptera littoralis]|uniref:Uncharacterized protein n=1 Tax=Spodoptera littoralis TaxID=7109 RepID=A0A9P0IB60_SPOLI|nr:unnamed protein product [Spodoptera littoralis]CAH1642646.1 unnamed protein product [Spodoptera littoralis]
MATLSTNVKKGQAVDDIANGPNILRERDSNKANDNTATSQETSIKDSDSEPDKNEKLIRELKESMNIKDIDVTILPDKLVTSDRDDSETDESKNEEDRDVTEDSSTDDHEEEKETAEEREETTPSKDKTNESSDDSDKTLIMDGMDDTQLDKIGDILNMERQKTKKQQSTETEDEYVTTTKPRRKKRKTKTTAPIKFNYDLVKKSTAHVNKFTHSALRKHKSSTHRKLHVKRITKNRITVSGKYTTKHKRLHANKLIKKSTNIREVEPTTHIIDEEAETSSGTTSVQVNIKRTPQSTTTILPYYKMIVDLDEGYMVVFLIELMRIMASKDKDDLFEVLVHTEQIVLHGRQQELSSEVNTIIDYADMLYDDKEGTKLFNVLKDFDDYPNTKRPGYTVCLALIESFLKPYHRLNNTVLRQRLLDSINFELRAIILQPDLWKMSGLGFLGIKEATEQTPSVQSHSDTTVSFTRKKQKKLTHKLQKLKSKPKHPTIKRKHTNVQTNYSNENVYRRRLSYTPETQYNYPLLRNMKPITSIQRRYKIVTPTHRHMLRHRSTRSYIVNLISRPTKEFTTKLNIATNQANTRFPFLHGQYDFERI